MDTVTQRVTCEAVSGSQNGSSIARQTSRRPTAFDMSIMAEMFGASEGNCFGHALLRHSCDVMRWKSRLSMIVSCRATSSGSMSISLIFFRLRGRSGGGKAPGARFPIGLRAAPCSCSARRC